MRCFCNQVQHVHGKNGLSQETRLDQKEQIENATGAAIPVLEWMNRFKLVVSDGHSDKWVELILRVKKCLPVREETTQTLLPIWRRVDRRAGSDALQGGARNAANRRIDAAGYRSASLVAGSALTSSTADRKSWSVVVTMFSISELARASNMGIV